MTDLLTLPVHRPTRHLHLAPQPVEQHPDWCHHPFLCGDIHSGEAAAIPATAGGFLHGDHGAEFPMAEVYAVLNQGTPHVSILLRSPLVTDFPKTRDWVGVEMPVGTAHTLTTALINAVCGVGPQAVPARSLYGAVTVIVAPIGEAVTVSMTYDGATLSAEFRPSEARLIVDAIGQSVDLATAPVVWVDEQSMAGRPR